VIESLCWVLWQARQDAVPATPSVPSSPSLPGAPISALSLVQELSTNNIKRVNTAKKLFVFIFNLL
jgi:hypothetical protein